MYADENGNDIEGAGGRAKHRNVQTIILFQSIVKIDFVHIVTKYLHNPDS
jgi:hypothetical protein